MKFAPVLALALLGVAMASPVPDVAGNALEVDFIYIFYIPR
jgi:hypothetical protein